MSCVNRCGKRKKLGLPILSVEEDAQRYGGCGLCGKPEWPNHQRWFKGFGKDRRCGDCYHRFGTQGDRGALEESDACFNCGRQKDGTAHLQGKGPERRCRDCRDFRRRTGRERPREVEEKRRDRGVKEGCKNPKCLRPEGVGAASGWRGSGLKRRCSRCRNHLARFKTEWPAKPKKGGK